MNCRRMLRHKVNRFFIFILLVSLSSSQWVETSTVTESAYNYVYPNESPKCPESCECQRRPFDGILRDYRQNQFAINGKKYRPDLINEMDDEYSRFFWFTSLFTTNVVEIKCNLLDGKRHNISSLLSVDESNYKLLEVTCNRGEELIWDVPSWETSFNMFIGNKCHLLPSKGELHLFPPMNMWVFEINQVGPEVLTSLNIGFLMNTISFTVTGSKATAIPDFWRDKSMLSVSTVNFGSNGLSDYQCIIHFTKHVRTIYLGGNDLRTFPSCLVNSNSVPVSHLSLTNNYMTNISVLFDVGEYFNQPIWAEIESIDLSNNKIEALQRFRKMNSLKVLDLGENFVHAVSSDVFRKLSFLKQVYLNKNKIHSLEPLIFISNEALEILDISFNEITDLAGGQFYGYDSLMTLDVRRNKLALPPFQDCSLNQTPLKNLRIKAAGNPFVCDCSMIHFEQCVHWLNSNDPNGTIASTIFSDIDSMQCNGPKDQSGINVKDLKLIQKCAMIAECPHMCDCDLYDKKLLLVNCSSRRLLELPDRIPSYYNATTTLLVDNNPLQMITYRAYLKDITELHADNCLISTVTPAAIEALTNIKILTLHNNLLQKLPLSTKNITLKNANNVTLHNNRWKCSCDSLWLPRWITKHRAVLWVPGDIVCSYQKKPVEDFNLHDVNCSTSDNMDALLVLCLALTSIVSSLVVVFFYRSEINLFLYTKLGIRFFSSFKHGDPYNPYDVFITYSQDNYKWVVDTLAQKLENEPYNLRLCLHYRDFPTSEPIIDNIPWAIRLSRCCILVLSRDFLSKEWKMMELRATFQRLLLAANRLILIAADDVNPNELSTDLRTYMNSHEYLRTNDAYFWEKLCMHLPLKKPVFASDEELSTRNDDITSGPWSNPMDAFEKTGILPMKDIMELNPFRR